MDDKPTASHFSSLAVTPIAALSPDIDSPEERYFHAVVTLLWPFSSATKQFSLLLSEPDPRLRGGKGQIKAVFREGAAEAVAKSSIGIGDTVFLSLQGANWKSHADACQSDHTLWELLFDNRVLLEAQRNSIPLSIVNLKTASYERANTGSSDLPVTPKRLSTGISSPISLSNRSWASPVFSRISNGPLTSPLLDSHIEDDGYVPGKGRKRTKFSRPSSDWVFVDSAPSPTKDGDMWDDENIETDNEELVKQVAETQHSPSSPSSENLLPTEENINDHESEVQNLAEMNGSEPAYKNSGTGVPPVSNLPEIIQDMPHDVDSQPTAVYSETVTEEQRFSPSLLGIETPRLHPVISPSAPAVSPLGTSIGTSTGSSMTPADSTGIGLPLVISPSTHEADEPCATREKGQESLLKSTEVAGAPGDLPNRDNQAPFDRPKGVLAESDAYPRELESTPIGTNDFPENATGGAMMGPRDLERIDAESVELLSTSSNASSEVDSGEDDGGTAIPVKSLGAASEEYGSGRSVSDHSSPAVGNLEGSTSPKSDYQQSVSSDGDNSSNEATKRISPRHAGTERTEQEVFVISDNESDAYESEVGSVTPAQISVDLRSYIAGGSEISMHSRSPSPEKSIVDEPTENIADINAVEGRASSATPNTNVKDRPLPARISDAEPVDDEVQPLPEDQVTPVSFANFVPIASNIRQPVESSSSQTSLHQYLSEAICNPDHSHIHPELTNNEAHSMDSQGEELISRFLAPRPIDFITPENTQGSWMHLGPSLHNLPFPIHLDPNLPTPQHSQPTEPIFTPTPFTEDHLVDSSHSYSLPCRPSTSSPAEVDEAKVVPVGIQTTEATDHSPREAQGITRQPSSNEHASIEPTAGSNIDSGMTGLRTKFSYFCPLSRLIENFNQSVDCIAVVVEITPINRAAKGAKDYYVSLKLTDESSGGSTTAAQIFHRKKDALPIPAEGDVMLLRNFRVQSLNHMMVLNNVDNSAWAVFPQESEEEVQMDDAPVEFGSEEQSFVMHLRRWYVQEGADLVARNISLNNQRESVDISSRSASEAGSQLRNIIKKRRRESRITYHELRDGKRYADVGSPSDNETIHELRNGTLYAHPG